MGNLLGFPSGYGIIGRTMRFRIKDPLPPGIVFLRASVPVAVFAGLDRETTPRSPSVFVLTTVLERLP